MTCTVKIKGELSREINIKIEVRQGDTISTLLVNPALQKVVKTDGN